MILSTLKAVCAAYHKKTASDLTINSVDLFLVAANNVRHSAELRHNFEHSRCSATIDIDGVEGADILDATFVDQAVPGSLVATGTITPAVTGTWKPTGGTFGGQPVYYFISENEGLYTLVWDSPNWIIYNAFGDADAKWTRTNSLAVGAYTPEVGQATGTLTMADGGAGFAAIKEVVAVMRQRPDGTFIPLDFARADIPIERDRTELEFADSLFPYVRYPSDADIRTGGSSSSIIQRAGKLEIYPHFNDVTATPLSVKLECIGWLNDYTVSNLSDASPTDFFVAHGALYLQWGVIIELNQYFKTFVPRTEGNLPEQQAKMDAAWRDFLLWDTYQIDSNTTRSR